MWGRRPRRAQPPARRLTVRGGCVWPGTLTDAGIPHNLPDDVLRVSLGNDLRVCLSFRPDSGVEEQNLRTLADQIVSGLVHAGLHLESTNLAEHLEMAERLVRRESLSVATSASIATTTRAEARRAMAKATGLGVCR